MPRGLWFVVFFNDSATTGTWSWLSLAIRLWLRGSLKAAI
jgi:hypothetical protein